LGEKGRGGPSVSSYIENWNRSGDPLRKKGEGLSFPHKQRERGRERFRSWCLREENQRLLPQGKKKGKNAPLSEQKEISRGGASAFRRERKRTYHQLEEKEEENSRCAGIKKQ